MRAWITRSILKILKYIGFIDKRCMKEMLRIVRCSTGQSHESSWENGFKEKFGARMYSHKWIFDIDRVEVGEGTYGPLNVLMHGESGSMLKIGSYCSIAPDVAFILESEHPYEGISTFPFKVKLVFSKCEATGKGDITVGDDVWIGLNAIICSGVTIGQGAIIAAGSVVAKNVEPYSIVGGNPARHLKYRFEDVRLREMLESLNYGNFNLKLVDDESLEKLYSKLTVENYESIVSGLFKKGESV
jgi:acetyltransferase-like isoleucine patch superfamily enzyme